MNEPQAVNEPQIPADPRKTLDLGRLLGQRRAFAAVAGRCSAAHAQLLRRIHDEKLYPPHAATCEEFCGPNLAVSHRHADRLISLLNPVRRPLAEGLSRGWNPAAGWQPAWSAGCRRTLWVACRLPICPTTEDVLAVRDLVHR
jgi:hypothetical protein